MEKRSWIQSKYTLTTGLSAAVVASLCLMLPGCSQSQLFLFDCQVYDSLKNLPLDGVAVTLHNDYIGNEFPQGGWHSENLTDSNGSLVKSHYTSRTSSSSKMKWRLEFRRDGYRTVVYHFGPIAEIPSKYQPDNQGRVVVSHIYARVCMERAND